MGEPYIPGQGDCASLASRVSAEVGGKAVNLPCSHATTLREQTKQILQFKDELAFRISAAKDGQPALFEGRGRLCHIGVMCWMAGEWWVLHADRGCGFVVRQRLREMTRLHFKLEGFYQWL